MKFFYHPETDSLHIELKAGPGAEVQEIVPDLAADTDASGDVVGLDIDHASRLDLETLETSGMPDAKIRVA